MLFSEMETFAKVWAKLPNGSQIPLRPTSKDEFEELGYQKVHEVHYFVSNDVNKGSLHPHPCTACSIHEFSWLYAIKSHNCTYSLRLRCSHKPQLSIRMPLFYCSNVCCSAIVPKQWRSCHPRTGASTQTYFICSLHLLPDRFLRYQTPSPPRLSPHRYFRSLAPIPPPTQVRSTGSVHPSQHIRVPYPSTLFRASASKSSEPAHPSRCVLVRASESTAARGARAVPRRRAGMPRLVGAAPPLRVK